MLFAVNREIHNKEYGMTIKSILRAISPAGDTLIISSDEFNMDKSSDKVYSFTEESGKTFIVMIPTVDGTDWAYATAKGAKFKHGNLVARADLSTNLLIGTELMVLGYPYGMGNGKKALYSKAVVAQKELSEAKTIVTTATTFEHGNSGGPVFATVDKQLVVIGIVSAGVGRSTGFVVPMANLK